MKFHAALEEPCLIASPPKKKKEERKRTRV